MRTLPRFAALLLAVATTATACATTVIDGGPGGVGGAGGSATVSSTHGTGGVTTDATGVGGFTTVSTTNGTGGWTTDATTGPSSTGAWMTTTDATTGPSSTAGTGGWMTTAVSSTSATTGTGNGFGACTDGPDLNIVDNTNVFATVIVPCAMMYVGNEPQTMMCIQGKSGLSQPCATCYDYHLQCIKLACLSQCLSNQTTPQCLSCLAQNCDPSFYMCSGLSQPPDHP